MKFVALIIMYVIALSARLLWVLTQAIFFLARFFFLFAMQLYIIEILLSDFAAVAA